MFLGCGTVYAMQNQSFIQAQQQRQQEQQRQAQMTMQTAQALGHYVSPAVTVNLSPSAAMQAQAHNTNLGRK